MVFETLAPSENQGTATKAWPMKELQPRLGLSYSICPFDIYPGFLELKVAEQHLLLQLGCNMASFWGGLSHQ